MQFILLVLVSALVGGSRVSTESLAPQVGTVSGATSNMAFNLASNTTLNSATRSGQTRAEESNRARGISRSPVCEALKHYPRPDGEKMPYENGEIAPICKPFVKLHRKDLDRCGDAQKDPYTSTTTSKTTTPADSSVSLFTWASRNEMSRKGKANLYADVDLQPQLPLVLKRVAQLKESAMKLCCANDASGTCRRQFEEVDVNLCKPQDDPNAPDPCVFGGSFKMPGRGYSSVFRAIHKQYRDADGSEFKRISEKNLTPSELRDSDAPSGPVSGSIVLSSYVSRSQGTSSLEPVMLHELGHACSMVRMEQASLSGAVPSRKPAMVSPDTQAKALRAAQWLDRARSRCSQDLELPDAYYDFWESVGESRGLAQCLYDLTKANQKQQVDRPCPTLCPGHYLEESVGIAFSLLLGELDGSPAAVYPNTCDHVRDGQHPMVSDVTDCLMQHSPRFRDRIKRTYNCQ